MIGKGQGKDPDLQDVIQGKVGVAAIAILVLAVGIGVADNLLDPDKIIGDIRAIEDDDKILGDTITGLFVELKLYLTLATWVFVILGIAMLVLNLKIKPINQ